MNDVTKQVENMLKDSAPVAHAATGAGRGPTGKLRNFSSMGDAKFRTVLAAVIGENNDAEALDAVRAEARSRGISG